MIMTRISCRAITAWIELNDGMLRFDTGDDATLVKVVYHGKVPVAEICHEYVPDIRADRRVTVMYPLVKRVAEPEPWDIPWGWRG